MVMILCAMNIDFDHVSDQILIDQEIPSTKSLRTRLLCVLTLTNRNLHDYVKSSAMVSTLKRGGTVNRGGRTDSERPQCSYCKRMSYTQENFPLYMVSLTRQPMVESKFFYYGEYLRLKSNSQALSST